MMAQVLCWLKSLAVFHAFLRLVVHMLTFSQRLPRWQKTLGKLFPPCGWENVENVENPHQIHGYDGFDGFDGYDPTRCATTKPSTVSGKISVRTSNLGHSILDFMILLPVSLFYFSLSPWLSSFTISPVFPNIFLSLYMPSLLYSLSLLLFSLSPLYYFLDVINFDDEW